MSLHAAIEAELGLAQARRSAPDVAAVIADATAGLPHQGSFTSYALADRGDIAADLFEPSLEAARQRGAPVAVAGGHGIRAFVRLLDGELAEAGGDADIAMHILRGVQISSATGVWSGAAIRTAVSRGDFATAESLLTGPWSKQPPLTGIPAAIFLCARGELRRATGRLAEARHDYLAASERISWLPLANPEVFPWRTGLAQCDAALGNEEKAREIAAEAVEAARAAGGTRGIGIALRAQGTVCSGEEAIGILREAVATLAGTRARLEHAHALAALEASGARPRKAVYTGVESLTPSELRVARLATEGKTNREIAQALTVTEKTIETHMRHVFQKLDVGRRTELAEALKDG